MAKRRKKAVRKKAVKKKAVKKKAAKRKPAKKKAAKKKKPKASYYCRKCKVKHFATSKIGRAHKK